MTERQPRIPRRSPKSKWPATICHQVTCLLSHSTGAMLQVADNPHESSSADPGTCLSTLRNITAQLLGQSWVQEMGTSRASRVLRPASLRSKLFDKAHSPWEPLESSTSPGVSAISGNPPNGMRLLRLQQAEQWEHSASTNPRLRPGNLKI